MAPYPWQEMLWQALTTAQHPPQGLLLFGAAGRGKADFAFSYAEFLLGSDPEKHPDFYHLTLQEKEKSLSVDSIRELIPFSQKSCLLAKQKVVIINPADKLTIAGQQAFLKTLEEPVANVTYILIASQTEKLLPTVKSRCQSIHIKPVPFTQAKVWLEGQDCHISDAEYALTAQSPLAALSEDFKALKKLISELGSGENIKFDKIDPNLALEALYYNCVSKIKSAENKQIQKKYYSQLDRVQALRKKYSEITGLNMSIQLAAI